MKKCVILLHDILIFILICLRGLLTSSKNHARAELWLCAPSTSQLAGSRHDPLGSRL